MKPIRFPLDPIVSALEVVLHVAGGSKPDQAPRGLSHVADVCGVSLATAKRWLRHGLTEPQADRVACEVFNLHPALFWPDWWERTEHLVRAQDERDRLEAERRARKAERAATTPAEISELVRSLRDFLGASQAELGKWFDVGSSTVCGWERGTSTPTTKVLAELRSLHAEIVASRNDLSEAA